MIFAAPWVLLGLAALPALWWLLRVTPPAPRVQDFPAIRLLAGLRAREQTAARTPLVAAAAAHPGGGAADRGPWPRRCWTRRARCPATGR